MRLLYLVWVIALAIPLQTNATPDDFPGNLIDFNGGHFEVPDNNLLSPLDAFTLEAWIKPSGSGLRPIMEKYSSAILNGGYSLRLNSGGQIVFTIYNVLTSSTITASDVLTNGQWYHVAATYNKLSKVMTIYVNGNQSGFLNVGLIDPLGTTNPLYIGRNTYNSSQKFSGQMDELKFWNVTRTPAQIRSNFHLTLSGTETGLVAYWQANGASGDLIDCIGGNDGLLNGSVGRSASMLPIASGSSHRIAAVSNGNNVFTDTKVSIDFTGVSGNKEVVVFMMNRSPEGTAVTTDFTDLIKTTNMYWIMYEYGSGSYTSAEPSFDLSGMGFVTTAEESEANIVRLLGRGQSATGSWTQRSNGKSANASSGMVTLNSITSFAMFQIGAVAGSSLPVEWISFTGKRMDEGKIRLEWITENEQFNDRFEIEHSTDGQVFNRIGFKNGMNNTEPYTYQFDDRQDLAGNHYYRLKQVDYNGQYMYSSTILIKLDLDLREARVYPNPTRQQLNIQYELPKAEPLILRLTDASGRDVYTETIQGNEGVNKYVLDLKWEKIPKGVYAIRLLSRNFEYSGLVSYK